MATEYGFVYVLRNDSMPGIYKIGMTLRSPRQRAEELSAATGVPTDFEVAYYAEFEAPREVEMFIRRELDDHRVNESREFFKMEVSAIADFIDSICPLTEWVGYDVSWERHLRNEKKLQVVS